MHEKFFKKYGRIGHAAIHLAESEPSNSQHCPRPDAISFWRLQLLLTTEAEAPAAHTDR